MFASSLFIITGLLIMFFPPLLSIAVGLLLIVVGVAIAVAVYDSHHRSGSIKKSRLAAFVLGDYRF